MKRVAIVPCHHMDWKHYFVELIDAAREFSLPQRDTIHALRRGRK